MSQRIFLHVGSHKTGTTAIQHWLADNAQMLHQNGLFIPTTPARTPNNFRPLAAALTSEQVPLGNKDAGIVRQLRKEVKENPQHDVILSAERFSYELLGRGMKLAGKRLDSMGLTATACLFIRNPIDLMNSAYIQKTKRLNVPESFATFKDEFNMKRRADWDARTERLKELNLDPRVVLFSRATRDESLAHALMKSFDLVGRLPPDTGFELRKENTSVGELGALCATELGRWLDHADLSPRPGNRNMDLKARDWLSTIMRPIVEPFDTIKFNGLSTEDVHEEMASLMSSLRRTADKYLGGDLESLLASDTADLPQSPTSLDEVTPKQRRLACELIHETVAQARTAPEFETFLPTDFSAPLPR